VASNPCTDVAILRILSKSELRNDAGQNQKRQHSSKKSKFRYYVYLMTRTKCMKIKMDTANRHANTAFK